MVLQDLELDEKVTLELIWNDNHYMIASKVIAKSEYGTIVEPFFHNGSPIELNSSKCPTMNFNLYGIDKSSEHRKVWRNITIETISRLDTICYLVRINGCRTIAADGERRQKKRIPLNCQASVHPTGGFTKIVARMHDISEGGIGFTVPVGIPLDMDNSFTVSFSDNIRGHEFSINVTCTPVHRRILKDEYLIGCSYTFADKNLLIYLCLKRAEYEANREAEA